MPKYTQNRILNLISKSMEFIRLQLRIHPGTFKNVASHGKPNRESFRNNQIMFDCSSIGGFSRD